MRTHLLRLVVSVVTLLALSGCASWDSHAYAPVPVASNPNTNGGGGGGGGGGY
jgi:hypothetical protein